MLDDDGDLKAMGGGGEKDEVVDDDGDLKAMGGGSSSEPEGTRWWDDVGELETWVSSRPQQWLGEPEQAAWPPHARRSLVTSLAAAIALSPLSCHHDRLSPRCHQPLPRREIGKRREMWKEMGIEERMIGGRRKPVTCQPPHVFNFFFWDTTSTKTTIHKLLSYRD